MNFNLEMEKRQEKITGILEYYLPDVWRRRADHRAFYGSDGDDTYPLIDPR